MRIVRCLLLMFTVMVATVGCDQGTKQTAKRFLEPGRTISCMGDVFRLSYAENPGAFLGLGAGLPEAVRRAAFLVLEPLLLFGLSLYVLFNGKLNKHAITGSALIIGGGIGNLIDRLANQGAVIDFMNIGAGQLRTGIFNVADVAIMAGALMLMVVTDSKTNTVDQQAVPGPLTAKGPHDHDETH